MSVYVDFGSSNGIWLLKNSIRPGTKYVPCHQGLSSRENRLTSETNLPHVLALRSMWWPKLSRIKGCALVKKSHYPVTFGSLLLPIAVATPPIWFPSDAFYLLRNYVSNVWVYRVGRSMSSTLCGVECPGAQSHCLLSLNFLQAIHRHGSKALKYKLSFSVLGHRFSFRFALGISALHRPPAQGWQWNRDEGIGVNWPTSVCFYWEKPSHWSSRVRGRPQNEA